MALSNRDLQVKILNFPKRPDCVKRIGNVLELDSLTVSSGSIKISAGFPYAFDESSPASREKRKKLLELFTSDPANTDICEVWGDSMEPLLMDGEYMVVDLKMPKVRPAKELNGRIVIAQVNNECLVKKYIYEGKTKQSLVAINPKYPVQEIKDGHDFKILAVVTKHFQLKDMDL